MLSNRLVQMGILLLSLLLLFSVFGKKALQNGCSFPKMNPAVAADPTVEMPVGEIAETDFSEKKRSPSANPIESVTIKRVAAEALCFELAEAFLKSSDAPTDDVLRQTDWQSLGLSADEIAFYRSIRGLVQREGQDFSGDDWLKKLRQANYIYGEVLAVFEKTKPGGAQNPSRVWQDETAASRLETSMKSTFSIDDSKLEGFLKKYPKAAPGKWAALVFFLQN